MNDLCIYLVAPHRAQPFIFFKFLKIMNTNKIAPSIEPEYLNQEVAYFEDEVNTFCLKTNSAAICYCTNDAECNSFAQCLMANKTLKELKIKAF